MPSSIDRYRQRHKKDESPDPKKRQRQVIVICAAAGLVLVFLVVLLARRDPQPSPKREPAPQQASTQPPAKRTIRRTRPRRRTYSPGGGQLQPDGPRSLADLLHQADNPSAPSDTVTGLLSSARQAMRDRDLESAREHADAAVEMARSPTELKAAERVRSLLDSLETFWNSVRKEAKTLRGGQELIVAGAPIMISEAQDGALIILSGGKLREFDASNMPKILALTLAQRRLLKGHPGTNLHVGSFLAMDAQGDRREARWYWALAGEPGRNLMPELDHAPPVQTPGGQTPEPSPEPTAPRPPGNTSGQGPETGEDSELPKQPEPVADHRLPVPEMAAQVSVRPGVQERFQKDLDRARRVASDKPAVARRLVEAAGNSEADPAERYVMYCLARNLTAEAGDPDAIWSVIDAMAKDFEIDAMDVKAMALLTAWRSKEAWSHRQAVAQRSTALLDAAMRAKNYSAADRVVRVAVSAARNAKDYRKVRELEEQADQIKALLRNARR